MKRRLCLLVFCFLLFYRASADGQCPAILRFEPDNCGSTVYYDIDVGGNLVEVDYQHATERIMRNFAFDGERMPQALGGFCDVAGEYVCLYVKKPLLPTSVRSDRWLVQFGLWEGSGVSAIQTNILFNYAGDWVVVPVDRQKVYVWYFDIQDKRRTTRLVFDPSIHKVVGEFDFDLRDTSIIGRSHDGQHLYIANFRNQVAVVDSKTNRERGLVSFDSINGEAHDWRETFTMALSGSYVLVVWKYPEEQEMKLWLYDLDRRMVLAQSELMPILYGRFTIECDNGIPDMVRLVAMDIARGRPEATGTLHSFMVEGGKIVKEPSSSFNTATEILLVDAKTGKLIVVKRKGVGHISILHVEPFVEWMRENMWHMASEIQELSFERARQLLLEAMNGDRSNAATQAFVSSLQYKPDEWTKIDHTQTTNTDDK